MPSLGQLFWSFFKIGTFTLGGGYAMIPLMEKELVDRHGWITNEEFMEIITLAQTLPGIFAANMAVHIGWRLRGIPGAVISVLGNILMPILIIIALAAGLRQLQGNAVVEAIFKGVRPVVVALIAAPVFRMAKTAHISRYNFWIPVVAALLIWLLGVSPIWVILIAGIGGFIYGKYLEKKEVQS
jgi:chromate transporter